MQCDVRERALRGGLEDLAVEDLLALLLSTGLPGLTVRALACRLTEAHEHLDDLARAAPAQLARIPGVGVVKGLRLAAAFELGRRSELWRATTRPRVQSSEDVAAWMRPRLEDLTHEQMWVVALDGQNRVRATRRVAEGGLHGCAVGARDILRVVLLHAASGFVLVHNHPSGDPSPSSEDIAMTRVVLEASELLGVALLDHVVIARGGHRSMLDLGLLGA